jgi:hypothetical protein
VIVFVSGAAVGTAVSHFLQTDSPTQQTSFDRLQPPDKVIEEITQVLNHCEPDQTFSNENTFGDWLSNYLREYSDYGIETRLSTEFGKPDILVDNTLAIELKKDLTEKSDQDRCVGQCIRYAQRWYTMLVLLDTPASEVHDLDTLLDLAGLEEIPIFELYSGDH